MDVFGIRAWRCIRVLRELERREAGKAETGHDIFKGNGFKVLMAQTVRKI